MSAPRGFPSQEKLFDTKGEHATIEPIRAKQQGLSVNAAVYVYEVGTDAVEAGSTETVINATAHAARKGDVIRITSGALDNTEVKVFDVTANTIQLCEKLNSAPAAAVTFQILRAKYPVVTEDGFISVTVTPSPIAFVLDTVDTEVNEDTVTPANSRPLPVKLMDQTGVEIGTASLPVRIDPTGSTTQPVSAASLPLPAGAATSALQTAGNASLSSIDGKIVAVNTGAVVVSSSALPSGASTSALQTSGNASLSSIDGKIVTVNTGAVVVSSSALPSGAATAANQATEIASLASIDGKLNSLGQKAMAASVPVVIASDQSAVAISAASLPLPSGAATSANQATEIASLSSIDTKVSDKTSVQFVRNDYSSVNVTTGAYVQLIASTSGAVREIEIFDSSGQTLKIATGAAASEVDKVLVFPGGNGRIPLVIPASTRISIRAVSATANAGEICINLYG